MIRPALALSALLLLSVPAGSARAASDFLRDDGTLRYRFYTDWELMYVERDRTPDVEVGFHGRTTLFNGMPNPNFREALGTDDVVDDDEEFGGRAVMGMRLNATQAVEIVFMGFAHDRSASVRDKAVAAFGLNLGNLYAFEYPTIPISVGTGDLSGPDLSFDGAEAFDLEYDSDFYSGELNFRQQYEVPGADYRFNLLAGIRAIRLEEDLDFTAFNRIPPDFTGGGAFPPGRGVGTYNISTRNTLIGAQLGFETFVPVYEDWVDFDLYAVGGGYANQATSYVDFFSFNEGPNPGSVGPFSLPGIFRFRRSRTEWDPAGVFEVAAHLSVKVWRGVRIKGGYRMIYLINIAAAPDQFARSGAPSDLFGNTYDNDGNTVFHGPSINVSVDF